MKQPVTLDGIARELDLEARLIRNSPSPWDKEPFNSVAVAERKPALVRAAQAVVEAARHGPCRHTAEITGNNCPLCVALAVFQQRESGE